MSGKPIPEAVSVTLHSDRAGCEWFIVTSKDHPDSESEVTPSDDPALFDLLKALTAAQQQGQGGGDVVAWLANDGTGRVIDAKAKAAAARAGGATASAMAAYTIPLAPPSAPVGVEAAEAMGARGGPASESERLAFEAWMRGHCWPLCATWDGTGYRSDAEQGGRHCPDAARTRGLWAAWRDRAALAQQPAAVDEARFRKAPCYLCGYNGPGYFQPETHPCAALYHAAQPGGLAALATQHQEPKS